ncbi:MAG: DUF6443 domain-containing protein [Bacteroidota bacterium]
MFSHIKKISLLLVALGFFMLTFGSLWAQSPQVTFIVGNTNTLSADDQLIYDRLSISNGYQVSLLDDNLVANTEFAGGDLILISHSVNPSQIGTTLTQMSIPIMCMKFLLLDELDMATANTRGANQTALNIQDPAHPLADGNSGTSTVYNSPRYLGYGNPGANASKVAIMGNKQNRATLFSYESGVQMLNIVAPARRSHFFLATQGDAQALSTTAWELFDATSCWTMGNACGGSRPANQPPTALINVSGSTSGAAPFSLSLDGSNSSDPDGSIVSKVWDDGNGNSQLGGDTFSPTYQEAGSYTASLTVTDDQGASHSTSIDISVSEATEPTNSGAILFVVGNANSLSEDDTELKDRIIFENGKDVVLVDDGDLSSANPDDYDAIVISHTVNANLVGNTYQHTNKPVFLLKWILQDDMGLATRNTRATSQTDINIHSLNHRLAQGYSGAISVYTNPSFMGYGSPGLGAEVITTSGNRTSRATIFVYEKNAAMAVGTAPAKRASFFISGEGDVGKLSEDGWAFFDRIIDWISPSTPIIPISACAQAPIRWANPSPATNRIISRTFRKELTDASQATLARDVLETVTYVDGLGKVIQSHAIQASPELKDMVSFQAYNDIGLSPKQYLPFGISNNDGALLSNPIASQQSFYTAEFPNYSSQTLFAESDIEASPLDRVWEQGAVGDAWQIERNAGVSTKNGHTLQTNFRSNYYDPLDPNTHVDQVLRWQYSPSVDKFSVIAHYSNNELSVTESIDENKSRVLVYKDKLGNVILRREEIDSNTSLQNPQSWSNTYFLYDDRGNLRHVIQPAGLDILMSNGYNLNDGNVKDHFLFSYTYDELNRLVAKKVPNSARVMMVYDQQGRLVLSQDGNLATQNQWTATKYDALGRPVITGLYQPSSPKDRTSLQAILDASGSNSEKRAYVSSIDNTNQAINGYTNTAFPATAEMQVHSITYLDDYDFLINGISPAYIPESLLPPNQENTRTKGMTSGTQVRILESNDWLWTLTYYDEYGKEIQTQSDHHKGKDLISQQLNFAGEILKTVEKHNGPQGQVQIIQEFCYDHQGRLIRNTHQVDQEPKIILTSYAYDELGRQKEKNLHSTDNGGAFLQSIDYKFNIRNWVTDINQLSHNGPSLQPGEDVVDLFSMQLSYESDILNNNNTLPVNALFNGNISAIRWQDAYDRDMHIYSYGYDKMNRLIQAEYAAFSLSSNSWNKYLGRYNTTYAYDKNGNIVSLSRQGKIGANSFGLLDDLAYTYKNGSSNQLLSISDQGSNTGGIALDQFLDGNLNGDDYVYDANGNITEDRNKGISITYNHLNKPTNISFTGTNNNVSYVYTAAGTKLTQTVSGSSTTTRDYINGFHYTDNDLEFFVHGEGRVVKEENTAFHYEYNLQDHLGNVRLSFADLDADKNIDVNTEILQTDHYYPFGLRMSFNASQQAAIAQRYTYNGKELQDDFGLNWLDYGARMYDASIGRWNGVDALAEHYKTWSPYVYTLNSPVIFIDPDGKSVDLSILIRNLWNSSGIGETTFYSSGANQDEGDSNGDDKKKENTEEEEEDDQEKKYGQARDLGDNNLGHTSNRGIDPVTISARGRSGTFYEEFARIRFRLEEGIPLIIPGETNPIDPNVIIAYFNYPNRDYLWMEAPYELGIKISGGATIGTENADLNIGRIEIFEITTSGEVDYLFNDGEVEVEQSIKLKASNGLQLGYSRGFTGHTSGGYDRSSVYESVTVGAAGLKASAIQNANGTSLKVGKSVTLINFGIKVDLYIMAKP